MSLAVFAGTSLHAHMLSYFFIFSYSLLFSESLSFLFVSHTQIVLDKDISEGLTQCQGL